MFHVKLLAGGGEVLAVAGLIQQVATEGPSALTVVIGLLAIVIGLLWSQGRKLAAIEARLEPLATREWTQDLVTRRATPPREGNQYEPRRLP